MTAADFLNRIRSTLDASLQRWEFITVTTEPAIGWRSASVRFLGTGKSVDIRHNEYIGEWRVRSADEPLNVWILGRLLDKTRDDSGRMEVAK